MRSEFRYDVFLSHSSKDKPAVRELAERLKKDGLRVWLDEWEILPGDLIGLKIEEGLEQSRVLVLAMSANAFASEWVSLERHTVLFRDPTNRERRFIPLRLDDAEIKDTLKQFAYVDWRERSQEQYDRLLKVSGASQQTTLQETTQEDLATKFWKPSWVLQGHQGRIWCMAITGDGRWAASGGSGTRGAFVRFWDLRSGTCVEHIWVKQESGTLSAMALTPDGQKLLCTSGASIWVGSTTPGGHAVRLRGHRGWVSQVIVSALGQRAVSLSEEGEMVLWDLESYRPIVNLAGPFEPQSIALSPNGQHAVAGSSKGVLFSWDFNRSHYFTISEGHFTAIYGVAVTEDGQRAASGSKDGTVRIWDLMAKKSIATLEGHTGPVHCVAMTADGRRVVSGSQDGTVRLWDIASGKCLSILEALSDGLLLPMSITPDGRRVIAGCPEDEIRVWDIPVEALSLHEPSPAARYTNAKVLLVGESGVGKTGLALRLAQGRFEPTVSTDAAWATQWKLPGEANTSSIEREIWLWDFAGQADYRLIHQLYMDETALAALVFNPQSEDPFEGLGQWDRDLERAARRSFRKLLVAGRCDRGGLMVNRESIARFQKERGFVGYFETSALTGMGCGELREAILQGIAWNEIPWTASPRIFKRLKEEVLRLKDEGKVLLRMAELRQQLEMRLVGETFSPEELRAVVGLLAGPGVVWRLEFGDFVVLQPERINAYAAAVIRSVRAHTEEIGCILEQRVLDGELNYQAMDRLERDEEEIVLRAMHQTFVERGLCLREHTEKGTLLVFPSYFKRERPELDGHPAAFVSYQLSGPLDEIYATLVVRLHHIAAFELDQLWRFAADFKTPAGKRAGLKMTKKAEGTAELTVYFEAGIPDDIKVTFIRYVHDHLQVKAKEVVRVRHHVCPHCETPVENRKAVQMRLERGDRDILCVVCEKRVPLVDLIEEKFASEAVVRKVRELAERARAGIDNESLELILVGHAFAIAGEAGQIFRPTANSDWGVDGEIEFKGNDGQSSGRRVYLQLKSGDSYLRKRRRDGKEVFALKNPRHAEYWLAHPAPVMLVIRTSDGVIRWMNVSDYLQRQANERVRQIEFDGEPFTALSVVRLRDRLLGAPT